MFFDYLYSSAPLVYFIAIKEIDTIKIPMKSKAPRGYELVEHPIIHPHRLLAYLFDHVNLEIATDDLCQYWEDARKYKRPWAKKCPPTSSHIPLALYGDSAKTATQYKFEKVTGIFLALPLWRPKSMRYSHFLLFSCMTLDMIKSRTLNMVWRRLAWSLNTAFEGVYPSIGCRGKSLSQKEVELAGSPLTRGRHKFIVTEYRGDWEYHRDTFKLKASWNGKIVCMKCPALSKGDPGLLYYNYGGDASDNCQWIQQEFSLSQFVSLRLKDKALCIL